MPQVKTVTSDLKKGACLEMQGRYYQQIYIAHKWLEGIEVIYIYIYVYICIYMYIYIYVHRGSDSCRKGEHFCFKGALKNFSALMIMLPLA